MARTRRAVYRAYLRSPAWRKLRDRVRARSGGVCERCGRRPMVHVHHITYKRIFKEWLADLLAVCRPCHRELHGRRR